MKKSKARPVVDVKDVLKLALTVPSPPKGGEAANPPRRRKTTGKKRKSG